MEKTRRKPWPCFMYSSLNGGKGSGLMDAWFVSRGAVWIYLIAAAESLLAKEASMMIGGTY
jgi:hypothetical protein